MTFALTGYVFGWSAQSISRIDTRPWIVPGAWTALEEDFAKDPPTYVVDVQFPAKNTHYPVRDFPILAGLLSERYGPVAWTSEGVTYQMNSSRGAFEKRRSGEQSQRLVFPLTMNLPVGIATLQHTDRWIGIPLCAFLTLVRKIIEPRLPISRRPP